jgi:hypothetical protein
VGGDRRPSPQSATGDRQQLFLSHLIDLYSDLVFFFLCSNFRLSSRFCMLDYYTSVPSVKTGTEPKRTELNGSLFGSYFVRTEFLKEPKNRTDRFG